MSPRKNPYARPDRFTRAAKDAGFPARSVFKLEEIDRRVRLLRGGHARARSRRDARELVDVRRPEDRPRRAASSPSTSSRCPSALPPHAVFVQGDALSLANEELARFAPYDVVLSDMAPRTTGNRVTDQARSFELFMRALAVAAALGARGGVVRGQDLHERRPAGRPGPSCGATTRPSGSSGPRGRASVSTEIFVVGSGKRA